MIWIIGNKGMLGQELSGLLTAQGIEQVGSDREVSILDPEALAGFANAVQSEGRRLSAIVNCAAYTAVDKAEDEPERAHALNAVGPEHIARLAQRLGARFLHISTDYVFDGKASRPYREDDPTGPTGVYGKTKEEGEKRVIAACPKAIIIRTAWLYGRHGPNFVYTMVRLMRERTDLGVVADQRGTPTWAYDLAGAISTILRAAAPEPGIYHFTNEGETTWYAFACEIYRQARALGLLDHDVTIRPLTTDQYPTKATRPAYSVLSKEKIKRTFGLSIPDWRHSLMKFLGSDPML
jgi:dTDP-4-dehydrorhamnose reductase